MALPDLLYKKLIDGYNIILIAVGNGLMTNCVIMIFA